MAQARAIDQTPTQAQAARAAVRAATHGDEAQAVSALLTSLTLDDAARAVDERVAALDQVTIDAVTAAGESWLVDRASHRREHLEQIARAI